MLRTHVRSEIVLSNRFPGRATSSKRDLGQPKIQNLCVAASGDKNICWLDVAVYDSFGMRGVQSIGKFNRQWKQNLGTDWLSVDAMLQRLAIEILHGDEA